MNHHSAIVRFMLKVEKSADSCWLWTGHKSAKGYGQFWWKGRARWAHRWAYEAIGGMKIPDGFTLNHKCHNPACCNPAHMEFMTVAENSAERWDWRRFASPMSLFGELTGDATPF